MGIFQASVHAVLPHSGVGNVRRPSFMPGKITEPWLPITDVHFTKEDMEAQRSRVAYVRSHS